MLAAFILSNRDTIIALTKERVFARKCPKPHEDANGIPVFLDQLVAALHLAESTDIVDHDAIGKSAALHGHDLLRMGLTIAQVVHDYGDLCQAITQLAVAKDAAISSEEFRTLNLCLDDAIAGAVTEFSRQRERVITDAGTERLGVLAHEMRNLLNIATLSFESIKNGQVAPGGSTGLVHSRSLMRICNLVDRTLADVRLDAGIEQLERISVAELVEELEIGAMVQARSRGLHLTVAPVDNDLWIDGDRQVLTAAMTNLLQNAFKFTKKGSSVTLMTRVSADEKRVLLEVEDECGGLPPGKAEDLFRPFVQAGRDRSGVGLGLSICVKAAKANGGELRVRDLPGKGCVFALELPRTNVSERA